MRPDLSTLEREFAPLLEVHAVELVALEWFQGPGHGILRVTIDLPNGDPRVQDPGRSVGIAEIASVTRDISAHLDTLDETVEPITLAYTLEVGSPGSERPVQKRADFDRFAGLEARIDTRGGLPGAPHKSFLGVLRGTCDAPASEGGFRVRVDVGGAVHEVPASELTRARTVAIKPPAKAKPGKGPSKQPSKRQDRLEAREKARAVNDAHLAGRGAQTDAANDQSVNEAPAHEAGEAHAQNDTGVDKKKARGGKDKTNDRHGKNAMTETAATTATQATGAQRARGTSRGGGPKHDGLATRTPRATTR